MSLCRYFQYKINFIELVRFTLISFASAYFSYAENPVLSVTNIITLWFYLTLSATLSQSKSTTTSTVRATNNLSFIVFFVLKNTCHVVRLFVLSYLEYFSFCKHFEMALMHPRNPRIS